MNRILAKLIRRVLIALNIDHDQYRKLVEEYIEKQNLPLKMQKAALRKQLYRTIDITNPTMTIGTVLKAAKVLKINQISISLEVEDKDGVHHKTSNIYLDDAKGKK